MQRIVLIVCLQGHSPKARDTARTPPTLQVPAQTTTPPALSMRCLSSVRLGLWSSDRGKAAGNINKVALQHKWFCQFAMQKLISTCNTEACLDLHGNAMQKLSQLAMQKLSQPAMQKLISICVAKAYTLDLNALKCHHIMISVLPQCYVAENIQ